MCGPPHQAAPTRRNATCRHCCSDSRFHALERRLHQLG
ncbi:hypothetical protein PXO_06203 [Xanthomonas oryzae pv. oryzae PXO99A]|uniref:Uncharacterized protein n=1 Tax=Xanthomonas oryzae pv. oryzae (strain PXO99A) TaxID=360094 RepID=A0A0K0GKP9_XANOP|nr:hypothetical protein PXO_06203 [Xanthomonas oryzae pv. oryzae PXO99A]